MGNLFHWTRHNSILECSVPLIVCRYHKSGLQQQRMTWTPSVLDPGDLITSYILSCYIYKIHYYLIDSHFIKLGQFYFKRSIFQKVLEVLGLRYAKRHRFESGLYTTGYFFTCFSCCLLYWNIYVGIYMVYLHIIIIYVITVIGR